MSPILVSQLQMKCRRKSPPLLVRHILDSSRLNHLVRAVDFPRIHLLGLSFSHSRLLLHLRLQKSWKKISIRPRRPNKQDRRESRDPAVLASNGTASSGAKRRGLTTAVARREVRAPTTQAHMNHLTTMPSLHNDIVQYCITI